MMTSVALAVSELNAERGPLPHFELHREATEL